MTGSNVVKSYRDAVVNGSKGKTRKLPTSDEESTNEDAATTREPKKQRRNADVSEQIAEVTKNKRTAVHKASKVRSSVFIWYSENNLLRTENTKGTSGNGNESVEVAGGNGVTTDGTQGAVSQRGAQPNDQVINNKFSARLNDSPTGDRQVVTGTLWMWTETRMGDSRLSGRNRVRLERRLLEQSPSLM